MLKLKILAVALGCGLAAWATPESKTGGFGRVHILAGAGGADFELAGGPGECSAYYLLAPDRDQGLLASAGIVGSDGTHELQLRRLDFAAGSLSFFRAFEGLLEPGKDGAFAKDPGFTEQSGNYFNHTGLCVLGDGSILASDSRSHRVVRTVPGTGRVEAYAGTGARGAALDASPLRTQLDGPQGIAQMPDGSVLILDGGNHRVLRVGAEGGLSVFAGTGKGGSRIGKTALETEFNYPESLAVGRDGQVWVADCNHRVLRIAPDRSVTHVAGSADPEAGFDPADAARTRLRRIGGLACLGDGSLLVADEYQGVVLRVAQDRSVRVFAGRHPATGAITLTGLARPRGLAVLADGTVLIADSQNQRILSISPEDELQERLEDLVARGLAARQTGAGEAAGVAAEFEQLLAPQAEALLAGSLVPGVARIVGQYLEPTPFERVRIHQARSRLAPGPEVEVKR